MKKFLDKILISTLFIPIIFVTGLDTGMGFDDTINLLLNFWEGIWRKE